MEVRCGGGHSIDGRGLGATAGLAPYHDVVWIPTEVGDVPPRPIERGDDIEQALVARICVGTAQMLAEVQIAQKTQTVIALHDHDVVVARKVRAVLVLTAARAAHKPATMQVEHDRPASTIRYRRRPDIQHQAIFLGRGLIDAHEAARTLHGRWAERERVANALPASKRRWRLEARGTARAARVGDAAELADLQYAPAAHTPPVGLGDHIRLVPHGGRQAR